jgi:hypothetical protein
MQRAAMIISNPRCTPLDLAPRAMQRAAFFRRLGCSLRRINGARGVNSGVTEANSDFNAERQKLMAGINYTTKFKHEFSSGSDLEEGLVKGCRVVRAQVPLPGPMPCRTACP